ncbi:MAG: DUF429 domain-containing protein, partial [Chloroflexota bacterium]
MFFIGLDLSDPFARRKRPCTRAVLDPGLACSFEEWDYDTRGCGILPARAGSSGGVLAVDGPQGLAGTPGQSMRMCERELRTAGKSSYAFRPLGQPYAGFVRGSVELFYSLVHSGLFLLHGMNGSGRFGLIEVYPGSAWPVLSGGEPLEKKGALRGRRRRQHLLLQRGLRFPSHCGPDRLPTHDQLDAALVAYIGFLFWRGRTVSCGTEP